MASGVLGTATSGLLAFQRALSTTGHNIANANTPGFSRQRVEFETQTPQASGAGYIGTGVKTDAIVRMYDQFLVDRVRAATTSTNSLGIYSQYAARVADLLGDADAGLGGTLETFFNAVQDVANDPTSIPARQVLLSEGESLALRFNYLNDQLNNSRSEVNAQVGRLVTDVNALSRGIADINREIVVATGRAGGQPPNDLLDTRDLMLKDLSSLVSISTLMQDDGSINVFIGNGQSLVTGFTAASLGVASSPYDATQKDITYSAGGGGSAVITGTLSGGRLGGLLEFRDRILDPAQNSLGRIGVVLGTEFNLQHALGLDLNGQPGGDFFNLGSPQVSGLSSNAGTLAVSYDTANISALTTQDYLLGYDGSDWTLTDRDGNSEVLGAGPTFAVHGLSISVGGVPAAGDRFLIRPTRTGAEDISMALTDVRGIAAASALRVQTDPANTGGASLTQAMVTDTGSYVPGTYSVTLGAATTALADGATRGVFTDTNASSNLSYTLSINGVAVYTQNEGDAPLADLDALATAINGGTNIANTGVRALVSGTTLYLVNEPPTNQPISINESLSSDGVLDADDTLTGYFGSALTDVSASANLAYANADSYMLRNAGGTVLAAGAHSGGNTTVAANGLQATLSGTGNLGDRLLLAPNTGGVGDNANMRLLGALQTARRVENGTTSFQGAYAQLIAEVGTKTRQADIGATSQQALLRQAQADHDALSGVNLDEEAANLVRYQQAYQAMAQVVTAAESMFQTLLNAIQR
ncbi:MAG: flagellar hook-associated protein FlgK [Gammaproteobacteria bacterium]